jgi:glutamyl-tRNA reductase
MIAVLGICHKSAPVSVRELYAFDEQDKIKFFDKFKSNLLIEGIVVLSTCNRTEIYINTLLEDEDDVYSELTRGLSEFKNIRNHDFQFFYFYTNEAAAEQLFKVSSGLESLVLGEEQILSQVKEAFRNAQTAKMTDCIISRLFIKAIEAGKRVRTETQLSKGAASISYATAELCHEIYPDLDNHKILLIGAGQTGDLVLQCLFKKNHPEFIIANRTFSKAAELASRHGGSAIELSETGKYISGCDIIITATSSKDHLITHEIAEKSMADRDNKMQVYIDISVPSNIPESVRRINNVCYYSVDDLKTGISKNLERRKSAIDASLAIINELKEEFVEWMDTQNLIPTIISIKENLRNIHLTELEGFIKYRKIKESDLIEQYSEYISEKYTEIFIKKLKQVTMNGKKPEYIKIINDLFAEI